MKLVARTLAAAFLAASAAGVAADVLRVPIGSQSEQPDGEPVPQLGMLQARVLRDWGEPAKRHDAVGDPPITRWEYDTFDVYFEYEHVIHAVRHHHPRQDLHDTARDD